MIPVVYCGNYYIFHGILLSSISIARRTTSSLNIIILTMTYTKYNDKYISITKEQVKILQDYLTSINKDSKVTLIDLTDNFIEEFENGKNLQNDYSPYTLLRLFIDQDFIQEKKVIYLDADTMLNDDINKLYSIDISEYEYASSLDYMGSFFIHENYCNAGVLLINVSKIKKTQLFSKCRKYIYTHKMIMPDQTALDRLTSSKLLLPRRFNEQRSLKEDTVIKHFNKGIKFFPLIYMYNIKQWEIDKVHKVLKIYTFDEDYQIYKSLMEEL